MYSMDTFIHRCILQNHIPKREFYYIYQEKQLELSVSITSP